MDNCFSCVGCKETWQIEPELDSICRCWYSRLGTLEIFKILFKID